MFKMSKFNHGGLLKSKTKDMKMKYNYKPLNHMREKYDTGVLKT